MKKMTISDVIFCELEAATEAQKLKLAKQLLSWMLENDMPVETWFSEMEKRYMHT